MAIERVRLNSAGVRDLLTSPRVLAELERRAENISAAAGDGHEVDSDDDGVRARASVRTVTPEAMLAEAQRQTLTRALDAGRR